MDEMINYICKDCNYKFKQKENHTKKVCPYCGSKSISEYKPTLASDLLDSVEGK